MLPGVGSAGSVRSGPRYYPFGIRHGIRGEVLTSPYPCQLRSLYARLAMQTTIQHLSHLLL